MQKKKFFTDGVVGGYGNVSGRQIFVYAYDFTVLGGTLSQMGAKKITMRITKGTNFNLPATRAVAVKLEGLGSVPKTVTD